MTQDFLFRVSPLRQYGWGKKWKLAVEMPSSLDVNRPVYVLMDSWYQSQTLMEACLKKRFHVIATLKTNRFLSKRHGGSGKGV
jgi:hypothetical protein